MTQHVRTVWAQIHDFPDYSVSWDGQVRNESTGRTMTRSVNQQGIVQVGMTRDGVQHRRSVTRLVAEHFLEPGPEFFDTPINLDGDRRNNHVDNLMWRPRHFAIRYHMQFRPGVAAVTLVPVVDLSTRDVYETSMHAAVDLGLLNDDIVDTIINGTVTFPLYKRFAFVK